MSSEELFLKYSFPCAHVLLQTGAMTKERYAELEEAARTGKSLSREVMEASFPAAFRRLEELAKEYEGKIHIYKIDTEKEKELAGVFGIQSIPAFLFVPKEGRPTMSNGIAQTSEDTKKMFKQMIDEILLGQKSEQL